MKITVEYLLEKSQLLKTLPRKKLLEIFLKAQKPLTLRDIKKKFKDFICDDATIYRTLKLFEKKGLIQSFQLDQKAAYFELYHHQHHHHVFCKKCSKIEHLDHCFAEEIEKNLKKKGYTHLDHKIEFFGLCPNCS